MPSGTKELVVFHGTTSAVATKIIQSGFDWRYNQRHAYGKGNYFVVQAAYAFGVATAEDGVKTVLVAKIVFNKTANGSSSTILPPEGCDVTVDDTQKPNVFVTYKVKHLFCVCGCHSFFEGLSICSCC